jgi:FO synthase
MDGFTGESGAQPSAAALLARLEKMPLARLCAEAAALRDAGHGAVVSYSRKVFIPLTRLCRDSCHYCTFARPPQKDERAYLTPDEVLGIARAGAAVGCKEALFTLGDKPERRYRVAREELAQLGHATTIEYLAAMCARVRAETGLLPHANPGVMTAEEIARLRGVSVSQGIMLESASERLCTHGGPHFGSPDKRPAVRLETIRLAGELRVPFTSGILIGIGETRAERVEALVALRDLHAAHGHIQEIIVQNFRAKPDTKMADRPEPGLDELRWTVAAARLIFGPDMNIQAPPNLSRDDYPALVGAGLNDWGGVSPVTPDHVNPEAPWPEIERLRAATAAAGKELVERLAIYPAYAREPARWLDASLVTPVLRAIDADGFAREDGWSPGIDAAPPAKRKVRASADDLTLRIIDRAAAGRELREDEIAHLFRARGGAFEAVCEAADRLRRETVGDVVTYVVNRNINYTNVCGYHCKFCAFSKGRLSANLRGTPYDLDLGEIGRRTAEAWTRGATEVCLQGGIHPDYTGETYLSICHAVKDAAPDMHVHAFSPLEVTHGARTLGLSIPDFLVRLKDAGLGTLPGTAAEILDDEVRTIICPDKVTTAEWLGVVGAAHRVGLKTTSTIMYGHVESYTAWARHLLRLRRLQQETGGVTEFVPLPFVHMEAPIYLRGGARKGPTYREAVLMHAVARLALHPLIPNIQVSWVKLGRDGASDCLAAGVNDLGGTLMNESISRAAGTTHGQELGPAEMEELIRSAGRIPRQRLTTYEAAPMERRTTSFAALPLAPVVETPLAERTRGLQSAAVA